MSHITPAGGGSGGGDATWTAPSLLNGWANFGAGYEVCQFRKTSAGLVIVEGMLTAAAASAVTVFTLPVGYRPAAQLTVLSLINLSSSPIPGAINILANGAFQVQTVTGTVPANTCPSHIVFYAEQ